MCFDRQINRRKCKHFYFNYKDLFVFLEPEVFSKLLKVNMCLVHGQQEKYLSVKNNSNSKVGIRRRAIQIKSTFK